MTVLNGYVTLAVLKSRLGITSTTTTDGESVVLEGIINTVSRWIDRYCARKFYMTTAGEVRYYTPVESRKLFIDDLLSVSTIGTDNAGDRTYADIWSTGDYDLMPYNAALEGQPYTWLEVAPLGNYTFPAGVRKAVKITGNWGYCTYATSAPYEVQEASAIQCQRVFKRRDSPFGIAGKSDLGEVAMIPRLDVDVKTLLDPYRKLF